MTPGPYALLLLAVNRKVSDDEEAEYVDISIRGNQPESSQSAPTRPSIGSSGQVPVKACASPGRSPEYKRL